MSRIARRERMASFLAEPKTLHDLLECIAGGGTMAEWSKGMDFIYGDVYAWVYDDPERLKTYTRALESNKSNLSDRVVTRLRQVMDTDIRQAFDAKGKQLPIGKMPDDVAQVMSAIETTTDAEGRVTQRLRFTPRERGIDMLGRHLKMFTDKVEVSGSLSLGDRLEAARRRTVKKDSK